MGQRLYMETYGCQMNEADTELIRALLARQGFEFVSHPSQATVILLNTCAVREHAEQRVAGRVSQLARYKQRNPELVLGLVGCMAQHLREKLLQSMPFLDLVVGPDAYRRLPALVEKAREERLVDVRLDREETYADILPLRAEGVRAYVTIMRGCDKFCTFCIVPFVRGRERSLPLEEILPHVEELVRQGVKEVVFLGQTVNSYRDGPHDFATLLRKANEIEGLARIRFTSPYPGDTTEAMIEAMATCEKVCPQIHFPLQSASDRVLASMKRGYTLEQYDAWLQRLRRAIPHLAVSTDIIVGFPTEREEDFLETCRYMERTRFDSAFMFKYSPRPGAKAYQWGDPIPEEEKIRRLQAIIELQERISAEINRQMVGQVTEVLVEGRARKGEGQLYGRNPQFKTVVFPAENVSPGALVPVRVEETTSHTLIGRMVRDASPTPCPSPRG